MRQDILKTIKGTRDVTNALILTHNIDFVFVQSVVIPTLRMCGSPKLTIFADADCATQTYQYQARVLSSLGRRYRVVPVTIKAGFRFHPKAVLLSGPATAMLLVGSGNLTYGGWRENGELWCQFDSQAEEVGVFGDFRSFMREVVDLCVQPRDDISAEVEEAFDSSTRSWAANLPTAQRLLGRAGRGRSMLEQMKAFAGSHVVEHLYVCAPYFDERAEALQALSRELSAESTTVLVQSKRTNLLASVAGGLGPRFTLRAAAFKHPETLGPEGQQRSREALLHAKFYGLQHGEQVTVFVGSANCSRAALTIPGSSGNVELMLHATMSAAEFRHAFLDEMLVKDQEPELPTVLADPPSASNDLGFIRVLAARMESGQIRVTFQAKTGTMISRALVDKMVVEPVEVGEGWATFQTSLQPSTLVLVGIHDDTEVRSLPHWIDNEHALRDSARSRSLAESINIRVRDDTWDIGAWTQVLSELYKHLQYMPKATSYRHPRNRGSNEGQAGPAEFEWDDVFPVSMAYRQALASCRAYPWIPRGGSAASGQCSCAGTA